MLPPDGGERLLLPQPRPQRPAERSQLGSSPAPGPAGISAPAPSARQPRGGTGPSGRRPARRLAALCLPLPGAHGRAERSGAGRAGKCSSREHRGTAGPCRGLRHTQDTRRTLPEQWLCVPRLRGWLRAHPDPEGVVVVVKSRNPRVGHVRRDHGGSTSLLNRVTPEHSVQDCIQMALEHLQ